MWHLLVLGVLLLTTVPEQSPAQVAALWEAQDFVDGVSVGTPSRACRIGGDQVGAMKTWPANCVVRPLRRTASAMVSEARCPSGRADLSPFYEAADDRG